ncbi:MAG TPA: hypothetical protein VFX49_14045 [Chloroflexota bacterium]|nr:hypothetical protein [Chloroflexota bacterium]
MTAIASAHGASTVLAAPARASEQARHSYRLYHLMVESQVPLPLLVEEPHTAVPDVILRFGNSAYAAPPAGSRLVAGLPCDGPCHNGRYVTTVHRGDEGVWFWHETVGTFFVGHDPRVIHFSPEPHASARAIALTFVGQVATFVLHRLGYPSLHASAVVTPRGAVAFLGHPGHGKSTMAAHFLRRGATLLTDDVLPLRLLEGAVQGCPGLPFMKVWQSSVEGALGLPDHLPTLTEKYEKRQLAVAGRYDFASDPSAMGAVYVLNRYDPVRAGSATTTVRRLTRQQGITALLEHASNRAFLSPVENAALLPLLARVTAQSPVRLLTYPSGFQHTTAVLEALHADLEQAA